MPAKRSSRTLHKKTTISPQEIKNILFDTKKNLIKKVEKENPEKIKKIFYEKNTIELNKIKPELLPYLLIINSLYAFEILKENYHFKNVYDCFKSYFTKDKEKNNLRLSPNLKVIEKIIKKITRRQEAIDQKINQYLSGWELNRLSLSKKIILRWGIYFLCEEKILTPKQVIKYSINFSNWFGEKKIIDLSMGY